MYGRQSHACKQHGGCWGPNVRSAHPRLRLGALRAHTAALRVLAPQSGLGRPARRGVPGGPGRTLSATQAASEPLDTPSPPLPKLASSVVQGDAEVEVEVRKNATEGFGRGNKQRMLVSDLTERLRRGSTDLYLSTQTAELDSDGHPALLAPPLATLPDLPKCAAVLGALVPESINIWAGCCADGASSGLHHDFHDNLYVLLAGSKRFRLFPVTQAAEMYTHGTVARVHDNGRCASLQRWKVQTSTDQTAHYLVHTNEAC